MKKLLISIIFVLFFLFQINSAAIAACTDTNATCYGPGAVCPSGTHDSSGTCAMGRFVGHCCTPGPSPTSSQSDSSSFSWGGWGSVAGQSPLSNFSNLLGSNAPKNASKASWQSVLSTVISLFFMAAFILSLVFLILGGINWMTSAGDKQKLTQARQYVIYAVIGLVIVFLSFIIIRIFGGFFGLNFLNLP